MNVRRAIPSVEKVLQALRPSGLPRPLAADVVRREISSLRRRSSLGDFDTLMEQMERAVARFWAGRIHPVINATGILVHTNLGRAPLARAAVEALGEVAGAYSNLECDLSTGERGCRAAYVERGLALLCGAQSAAVTNNCAAALVLVLRHFTGGAEKEVVISRGELIQIGGGFRIPEILESSGARLKEVGTTNRTVLSDYARAVNRETALILKVHRSNFFMEGFVEAAPTEALAKLARRRRVPLVEDLGSGAMVATERCAGLEHEPTPAERLKQGVDLVCFSGDKLLGGPQAGIIAGKARWIQALKRDPFFRVLRCDKLVLAALQSTVDLYLRRKDKEFDGFGVPLFDMLGTPVAALEKRAQQIASQLADLPLRVTVGKGASRLGGGTLPRSRIESATVQLSEAGPGVRELSRRLRESQVPVIGCLRSGKLHLDLRSVFPAQDSQMVEVIRTAVAAPI